MKHIIAFTQILAIGGFSLPYTLGNMKSWTAVYRHPLWLVTGSWGIAVILFGFMVRDRDVQQYGFSVDQALNGLIGNNRDITLSSMLGDKIASGKATKSEIVLCKALSLLDTTSDRHCLSSRGN